MERQTKIICTIGPSVDTVSKITKLVKKGMNCARLNFSHGTHESHLETINRIKQVRKAHHISLPILLDTKGPEIRLIDFADGFTVLKNGQKFILDNIDKPGDNSRVSITFKDLYKYVKPGNKIVIDDGKVSLKVTSTEKGKIHTIVIHGNKISNHKSVNVPNIPIGMDFMSKKDKDDLLFGIQNNVDFVAASFTRSKQDISEMRKFLDDNGGSKIEIIAKIENHEGVKNFRDILTVADGLMVARGDLGVEIPFKDIPAVQKRMVGYCNKHGKIAIIATQMLESMINSPRPTRAEVSDVANAIFDGASAVMLSGETASGNYPYEAVKTMSDISKSAFKSSYNKKTDIDLSEKADVTQGICKAAIICCNMINAIGIVVCTNSGRTAKYISMFRPDLPVYCLVADEKGFHQLGLYYGTLAIKVDRKNSPDEIVEMARNMISKYGEKAKGKKIILITGNHFSYGKTDTIQIYDI
ncbi:MAG: pyruvate kinase [Bacilli bacterium]|nr:pyruvate kinase [Bacilli bacterium]